MLEIKLFVLSWMIFVVHCRTISYEQGKCKTAGEKLKHGVYHDASGDARIFHCEQNYVSNIPNIEKIRFKCKFEKKLGRHEWKSISSRFTYGGPIYLSNVTCQAKKKCHDPLIPDNMTRSIKVRYQAEVTTKGKNVGRKGFFTGDTIKYNCKTGYALLDDFEDVAYQYIDYGDYGYNDEEITATTTTTTTTTEAPVKKTALMEVTCDSDGLWNGIPKAGLYLGECKEILCDATEFYNISNGNITNYKEKYKFFEEMKLECDEGFRPIGGAKSAVCTSPTSFNLNDFGCEAVQCIELEGPRHGYLRMDHNYVNGTAVFECEYGYSMIGNPKWQCQSNGKWDHECVKCVNKDMYCSPPCLPPGATITSPLDSYNIGDVLEFTCKSGTYYGGSTNRTCMRNRHWSGTPIDCTGDSLYEPGVGIELLSAMKKISENKTENATKTESVAMSKSIKVGNSHGVDVYLLVDVSKSITVEKLNLTKRFLDALLPGLGINDGESGTRLALKYFATETCTEFDQHMLGDADEFNVPEDELCNPQSNITKMGLFKSYKEVINITKMDAESIKKIHSTTKSGTAITLALEDIERQVGTKALRLKRGLGRGAQQVLIIISDGRFTSNGDPSETAEFLKDQREVEIYSIFIGDKTDNKGSATMEKIASHIDKEKHFFKISSEDSDLKKVLSEMIKAEVIISCGLTNPKLTGISDERNRYETPAKKGAWPWMANIRTKGNHICGGSLISDKWILTAAHCCKGKGENIAKVHLNKVQRDATEDIDVYNIEEKYIHPKYNEATEPQHLYDIALVRLSETVHSKVEVLPVCLWNDDIQNETKVNYTSLFHDEYGVVTGWGKRNNTRDSELSNQLKQMQMKVKSDKECVENLSAKEKRGFNSTLMFCAGGKEQINGKEHIIDSCEGDSGGPFVVRHPTKENKFIQTGIVSFGYGCKIENKYGFYTKLTEELLKWIDETIKKA